MAHEAELITGEQQLTPEQIATETMLRRAVQLGQNKEDAARNVGKANDHVMVGVIVDAALIGSNVVYGPPTTVTQAVVEGLILLAAPAIPAIERYFAGRRRNKVEGQIEAFVQEQVHNQPNG